MTRTFPLSVILTVTTKRMLCSMDELFDVLNYLTGDNLFRHVLPRAGMFAAEAITARRPELSREALAADMNGMALALASANERGRKAIITNTIAHIAARVGYESVDLSPLDGWQSMDPVNEMVAMRSKVDA